VLGLGLGYFLATNLGAILFNVAPADPLVFALTIVVLGTTGLAASLVPAMRAARLNPLIALRAE